MARTCNIRVRGYGAIAYPILLLLLLASCNSPPTSASGNLLLNGRLIVGAGSEPDSWRTTPDRESGVFEWRHENGELPELRITKTKDSYEGYWVQTVNLGAGWYYLTAEVLTGAHHQETPAALRVGEAGGYETLVRRAPTWTRLGLYFKVRGPQDAVEIGCGVADWPGTGIATFRDISLFRIYSVPPLSAHQFDFGQPDARPVLRPDSRVMVETSSSLFKEIANFRSAVAGVLLLALLTILDRCLVTTSSGPAKPASRKGQESTIGSN